MPLDLARLLAPDHSALVTVECQRAVVGDLSALPELAQAARGGVLKNIADLAKAARAAGVPVVHCTALRRPDGLGANRNARLFQYMAKSKHPLYPDSEAAALVDELEAVDSDLVLPRYHGLSPFQGTELDFVLRNRGVTTIVATGVSVNVAIQNLTFDAVNAGYQVVLPRNAVAGFPADYVEAVFEHTLGALATVIATADVAAAWSATATRS
ncbi:MAG: cysteine hydrolase [Proteobacteria bacterium]|nr:cysteine hydrolase [Pseudomonadota bacterium]